MPIDYRKYPGCWPLLSEYIRFVRANGRCETCGAENYKPHPVTGSRVVLTTAHIGRDKYDIQFDPEKYDPEDKQNRLVAECQRCHLWRDRKVHARNRRYGRNHNRKEQLCLEL